MAVEQENAPDTSGNAVEPVPDFQRELDLLSMVVKGLGEMTKEQRERALRYVISRFGIYVSSDY